MLWKTPQTSKVESFVTAFDFQALTLVLMLKKWKNKNKKKKDIKEKRETGTNKVKSILSNYVKEFSALQENICRFLQNGCSKNFEQHVTCVVDCTFSKLADDWELTNEFFLRILRDFLNSLFFRRRLAAILQRVWNINSIAMYFSSGT